MKIFILIFIAFLRVHAATYSCAGFYKSTLDINTFSLLTEDGNFSTSLDLFHRKNEIYNLYAHAYSKFGSLMFSSPQELIDRYPIGILYYQKDSLVGFLLFRETKQGLKLGMATATPTRTSLLAFRKLMDVIKSKSGWYAEVSGNSFRFMRPLLGEIQPISIESVNSIFSKRQVQPVDANANDNWPTEILPFVYRRTMKIGEHIHLNEKVMLGFPITD